MDYIAPRAPLTLLGLLVPQPYFGDKLREILVVCPPNGTAVLKGSTLLRLERGILVLLGAIVATTTLIRRRH